MSNANFLRPAFPVDVYRARRFSDLKKKRKKVEVGLQGLNQIPTQPEGVVVSAEMGR